MRTPKSLPSASKLQLALACAASQALPVIDSEWATGEAGNAKHRTLASSINGLPLSDADEASQAWLADLDEETLAPLAGCADEVSFALDPLKGTARVMGVRLERAYSGAAPGEMMGTADYVRVEREADSVTVIDLKTGQAETPHPFRNAQLRFLGLCAARAYGVSNVRLGVLHAAEGRKAWWSWATLDAFEVSTVAADMKALVERIGWAKKAVAKGETPRLTIGDHCNFCPARFGCPGRVAMAKRLAGEPEQVVMDLKAMLTPESAQLAYQRWRAAKKAVEEVGSALYAFAKESPISLGDGRVWGPVTSEREVIDAEKAWTILEEKYGPNIARAAMKLDASKAGVDRAMHELRESARGAAVRPKGMPETGKVTLTRLNEEALKALRDGGAVTKKEVTEYEEHQVVLPATSSAA